MAGMKTRRVALPATVVAAMGSPAMVLCLAGASPIATVATPVSYTHLTLPTIYSV